MNTKLGTENLRECPHTSVDVVNWYELVRKYRCNSCERILICECESTRSARFLPHQTKRAGGPGFWRVPVDGFAHGICHHCRGMALPPAPLAVLPNRKGKVQRYYWREIRRMTFEKLAAATMDSEGASLTLAEMQKRFPEVVKTCEREALEFWKTSHQRSPLYGTKERDQESFLRRVAVPVTELRARYEVHPADNKHPLGRFRSATGELLSAERLARLHYENQGWEVHDCERRLINALCSVLLSPVYQDPNDPRLFTGVRGSTNPFRDRSVPSVVQVTLPDDFGTSANYGRRKSAYTYRLASLMSCPDLVAEFDSLKEPSLTMREYLAVHDAEIGLARRALEVVPRSVVCGMLDWVVRDFWNRHGGWPDLFMIRAREYRFVEVKTKNDRLSQKQMAWFEWASGAGAAACEIVKVLPERAWTLSNLVVEGE
ncbi:MAG TPA: VRR-NUC domain-containing protein [Verrucomicrobiae bacterium]|nr:VRR-NUC domain-containing protein [Verrucomicrobiae bacterium]